MLVALVALVAALGGGANQAAVTTDHDAMRVSRQAMTAIELYYAEHGTYRGAGLRQLAAIDTALRHARDVDFSNETDMSYTIRVRSAVGSEFWTRRVAMRSSPRFTCEPRREGACPSDGVWLRPAERRSPARPPAIKNVRPAAAWSPHRGHCRAGTVAAVRRAVARATKRRAESVQVSQIACASPTNRGPLVGATWRLAGERVARQWVVGRWARSGLRLLHHSPASPPGAGGTFVVRLQPTSYGLQLTRTSAVGRCTTRTITRLSLLHGRLSIGRPLSHRHCAAAAETNGTPPDPPDASDESPPAPDPSGPVQAVITGEASLGGQLHCDPVRGGRVIRASVYQWVGRDSQIQQPDGTFPPASRDRQLTNGQAATLDITPSLLGMYIRCDVTAGGDKASSRLVMAPPGSTGSEIMGYAVQSEYVTCNGHLYGTGMDSAAHPLRTTTFYRDGVPIYEQPFETVSKQTYRLTPADVGHQITCRESGSNAAGPGASAQSAPIVPTACSTTGAPFCLPDDLTYGPGPGWGFSDRPAPCPGCSAIRSSWSVLVADSKVFGPGFVRTSAYKTSRTSAHVHVEVRTTLTQPADVRIGLKSCRTMGTLYCNDFATGDAMGAYQVLTRPAGPWVSDYDYDVHDVSGGDISAIQWSVGWLDAWVQTFAADVRFKCASWCGDDFLPIDAT